MMTQQVLFWVGLALLVIGVISLGMAIYIYTSRNITDILDDLSGKKRADAIAAMEAELSGPRRRGGDGTTSGFLGFGTSGLLGGRNSTGRFDTGTNSTTFGTQSGRNDTSSRSLRMEKRANRTAGVASNTSEELAKPQADAYADKPTVDIYSAETVTTLRDESLPRREPEVTTVISSDAAPQSADVQEPVDDSVYEGFVVVRKAMLMESTEYLSVGQEGGRA